jgi:hypothetical protein
MRSQIGFVLHIGLPSRFEGQDRALQGFRPAAPDRFAPLQSLERRLVGNFLSCSPMHPGMEKASGFFSI